MSGYKELLQQREELEKKIDAARKEELAGVIARVRGLVDEWLITSSEIFPEDRVRNTPPRSKVAPKYKDPATGKTWTGRGVAPKWIDGQDRSKFLIEAT